MLIGSDPELFAVDQEGFIVPPICAERYFPRIGTLVPKDPDYHPVYFEQDGYRIIGDGAAFEFNFPPSENPENLFQNWRKLKHILGGMLPQEYSLLPKAAAKFDLQRSLEMFPEVTSERLAYSCRFGCDPQENVYINIGKATPEVNATKFPWRYAGGHIHVSDSRINFKTLFAPFIYMMDQTVGLYCLFHSPYPEQEIIRQEFYGVPGNFRRQNYGKGIYGVEYRTPSVSWIERLQNVEAIFLLIDGVINLLKDLDLTEKLYNMYNEATRRAILEYDKVAGEKILKGMLKYV